MGRWQWWSKAPEESGEFHWQEAQRLIAERELSDARTHLQHCLDKWPLNAEVHFLTARCARRESDLARARIHLFAAEQLQWPHDQIVFEFQLQQAQTGNLPAVESSLWNYLKDEQPDEELVFEALAQGYFVNNSYGKIINLTALWLERFPDAWVPRLYRGHAFYLEKSLKQAIEEYRRVLELNPDQELAQIWLATALMDSGQFQEALHLFQDFARENPGNFQALYGIANCQLSLGKTQAAGEALQGLLAINPNYVKAIFLQAKLELAQENPREALTWLRRAERLAPRELDINHTLAMVLRRLNRIEEAEKYQRQQQEILNLNQRLKDLTQELRRNPDSASLLFQIG